MEGAFAVLPKTQFVDEEGMDDSVMNEGEVVVMRDETGEELHGVVIGVTDRRLRWISIIRSPASTCATVRS